MMHMENHTPMYYTTLQLCCRHTIHISEFHIGFRMPDSPPPLYKNWNYFGTFRKLRNALEGGGCSLCDIRAHGAVHRGSARGRDGGLKIPKLCGVIYEHPLTCLGSSSRTDGQTMFLWISRSRSKFFSHFILSSRSPEKNETNMTGYDQFSRTVSCVFGAESSIC